MPLANIHLESASSTLGSPLASFYGLLNELPALFYIDRLLRSFSSSSVRVSVFPRAPHLPATYVDLRASRDYVRFRRPRGTTTTSLLVLAACRPLLRTFPIKLRLGTTRPSIQRSSVAATTLSSLRFALDRSLGSRLPKRIGERRAAEVLRQSIINGGPDPFPKETSENEDVR